MTRSRPTPSPGFTLLEVIITLVVGAILMALIIPYLGTALTKSGLPLTQLRATLTVYQTMENITADYRKQQADATLDLSTLQNNIGAAGSDQANSYGEYHVVDNHFILFDAANQETGPGTTQDILKITLRGMAGGPNFTTLFTRDLP